MLRKAKFNINIDGQFGSTGKGVLNAWLAGASPPDICVSNASPNAGHTFIDAAGAAQCCFHLPVAGVILPDRPIYLCAGSVIDPGVLMTEIENFGIDPARLYIDPRACIVLPEHRAREEEARSGATRLASTRKGVGAALADKIARVEGPRTAAEFFAGHKLAKCIRRFDLMAAMDAGKTVLMEVPQGYGLSLNHGLSYPHCTSRDITVASALNDAGVHPSCLGAVVVSLRSYPIRVGHIVEDGVTLGQSGPFWPDSQETTWQDLGLAAELTTVTKRPRRVATFSYLQYADMLRHLRPDAVFINFVNYFRHQEQLDALLAGMARVESETGVTPEKIFGLGPHHKDVTRDLPRL